MAQSVQNVTLSLTLPISCQICLGKVRKPVICCNHHVFCSSCIEVWLQKCSQCPTCRVSITPENPCREILGATNESEWSESRSVRKHLRRTRGELLLREYEDELENLLQETEELRSQNSKLEAELKAALEPGTGPVSQGETPGEEAAPPDSNVLEQTTKKLRAASELYLRVTKDMDKLRDANKTLRSQNVDLVQENVRLRAEVENRSPQKFGRFTVAALEAKLAQYEREMAQLKKALDRSDKYIEELEAQAPRNQDGENGATAASLDPQKDGTGTFTVPSTPPTPSSVLGQLSLRSPGLRSEEKQPGGFKSFVSLRRLNFDDCTGESSFRSSSNHKPTFWSSWNEPGGGASADEQRMDAAFLDKVSELDSMMAEGEGSRSQNSNPRPGPRPELDGDAVTGSDREPPPQSASEYIKRKHPDSLETLSPSKLSKIK